METGSGALRLLVSLVVVFILSSLAAPAEATTMIIWNHYVYALGGDGPIMGNGSATDGVPLYASYYHPGTPLADNYALAEYFADFDYGAIGVRAEAAGAVVDFSPYGYTSTGRVAKIQLEDELIFTVEAGSYPDGVTVEVACLMVGSVSATLHGQCHLAYSAYFSFDGHTIVLDIPLEDARTIPIRDSFVLTQELVAPGATLSEAEEFARMIRLTIFNADTDSDLDGIRPNYVTGSAAIEVYNALHVTEVIAPAGVSWTSESGSFLSAVGAVGDPVAALAPVRLQQNHPNPFNPATVIPFTLLRETHARLRVFDLRGREVSTLVDRVLSAGRHEIPFRAAGMPAGTYCYVLEAEGRRLSERMTLVK